VAPTCEDSDLYVADNDDDCDDGDVSSSDAERPWYFDGDGDGYGVTTVFEVRCTPPGGSWVADGGDCDDSTPGRNPGATETCDGTHEDCDGVVDNGASPETWYPDCDGDGFGDASASPGRTQVACAMPTASPGGCGASPSPTWSLEATDCADRRPAAFDGAPEVCNGLDDDCDGVADNGVATTTWWPDVDGDGRGDASASSVQDCAAPADAVANDEDCDDDAPTVFLGAPDLCDAVVNDCAQRGPGVAPDAAADCGPQATWFDHAEHAYLFVDDLRPLSDSGNPDATGFCEARGYHVAHLETGTEVSAVVGQAGTAFPVVQFWLGGRASSADCGNADWHWYDPLAAPACVPLTTTVTVPAPTDGDGLLVDGTALVGSPLRTDYRFVCESP
jgi:hypothetical protein